MSELLASLREEIRTKYCGPDRVNSLLPPERELTQEFSVSRATLGRELRAMGFRKLSARPQHHAQDPDAIETFKKTSPTWSKTSASATAGRR